MKPPRIILLSASFFPFPTGATYAAIRLARSLRERGFEISFVVGDQGPEWRQGSTYEGSPVHSFPLYQSGKLRKLRSLLAFTRYIWKLRREFDVFHISGGGYINIFLGWWVKFLTGRKVSLKISLDGWDTPEGAVREKWGRWVAFAYRRIDGVVAMTSGQAEKCWQWNYRGLLSLIPNGVDITKYRPSPVSEKSKIRAQLGIADQDVLLVYVGWLGYRKGTDVLLKVWERLRARYSNVGLLLLGDYMSNRNLGDSFPDFARKYGITPSILESTKLFQVGHVEDVERYLQTADIFVFPSRQEGFGTVQTEAMACGLPCVVNDLPGVSCDIFPDEKVGFRIYNNDVDDYVRVISDLIAHPEKREQIGHAARCRVKEVFSREIVATQYVNFMERLVSGCSGKTN